MASGFVMGRCISKGRSGKARAPAVRMMDAMMMRVSHDMAGRSNGGSSVWPRHRMMISVMSQKKR